MSFRRRLVFVAGAALVALVPRIAAAQFPGCADVSVGYDGKEPADFTHYVDEDGDTFCDDLEGDAASDEQGPVNGFYPDCTIVDANGSSVGEQLGHGHWAYTRSQTDCHDYGGPDGASGRGPETEEKDYWNQPDRFLLNEGTRFDRALGGNQPRRYWQEDQWIGPTIPTGKGPVPLITWTERFYWDVFGQKGAYWSNQSEAIREAADPYFEGCEGNPECGFVADFSECGGP